ncbi:hypothetical protein [Serratia sp. D1N4]
MVFLFLRHARDFVLADITQRVILHNNVIHCEAYRKKTYFSVFNHTVTKIFRQCIFTPPTFFPDATFTPVTPFPRPVKEQLHPHHSSGVSRCHYRFSGFLRPEPPAQAGFGFA